MGAASLVFAGSLAPAIPAANGAAPPEDVLFPILVRNRWGFIDRSGHVVVRPQFESTVAVEAEREGSSRAGRENTDELFMAPSVVAETTAIVAVKSGGNWGFLDQRGELLPLRFDQVGAFSEGLAPVRQGERWGFVSMAGTIAVPVMFDLVDTFHGGVAIVSQDARFGVVDPEGRFVVKPRFESIRPADSVFYDNRALFTLFDKKGYVSRAGTIAVPPRFDAALPFSEGLAAVTRGDDTGYIDTTGRMVIAPRWWSGSRFSRGRAVVIMGSLCGYIDRNGAFIAKPQFTDAKAFNAEDRALAWKGPVKGWLDLSGRWTPTRIDELQRLDDSLSVVVVDGRTWLMRRAGEQTIREYPWHDLGPFREGLARARGRDGRFGFIDLEDRVVIPLRFQQAAGFDHGLCKATTRDTLGYIDRTGAWVWSSRFR